MIGVGCSWLTTVKPVIRDPWVQRPPLMKDHNLDATIVFLIYLTWLQRSPYLARPKGNFWWPQVLVLPVNKDHLNWILSELMNYSKLLFTPGHFTFCKFHKRSSYILQYTLKSWFSRNFKELMTAMIWYYLQSRMACDTFNVTLYYFKITCLARPLFHGRSGGLWWQYILIMQQTYQMGFLIFCDIAVCLDIMYRILIDES